MRRLLILLEAILGTATTGAFAHAFLNQAAPPVGGTVPVSPKEIRLTFSESVEPHFSGIELAAGDGRAINTDPAVVDPGDSKQLVLTVPSLSPGRYRVHWHVVSVDTHRTEGEFTFVVGQLGRLMEEGVYICRFVQFVAAIILFGTVSFRLYGVATCDRAASSTIALFDAWVRNITRLAAIASLASALAFVLFQSATMAASPAAALDPSAWRAVLFETRFGRVWSWHLLIALVLVSVCFGRSRGRATAILILALLLLASLAWIGHAAMQQGLGGIARELNQTVHLLAAGLWLGGLVPLGWLLRRARVTREDVDIILICDATRHFSQVGYFSVALLALTGAVNGVLLVGSLEAMFGTPYGRLLACKILLFLVMLGVALVNRLYLAPRISRDPVALGALCRTVALEQGLGLSIIAAVSILGTWPPAIYAGGR